MIMKKRIFGTFTLTFLLVLLFTLPKNLSATVYYVAPNGNDSDIGKSLDVPLSTLTKAAELLKPGDTVFVMAGVYTVIEPIAIFCSGTEDQPVVFKNYDPERPVFNFSGIPGKSSGITGISFLKGSQYIVFDGFELANGRCTGMRMTHCRHITVRNCVIHDFDYVGLSVASDECLIENNELYRICMAFENCNNLTGGWPQVMNANAKPPIPPAIVRSHAMNNVFRGNVVHDSWGEGIDAIFADGVIIEDNIVYDVFSVGIYLDGSRNAIIRNNYIYSTNDIRNRASAKVPATGILLGSEYFGGWSDYPAISHVENIYIYNNVLSRVGAGIGHWIDHNNTDRKNIYENVRIFNNTVDTYEGRGDGIRFATNLKSPTRGNECRNNIFRASLNCNAEESFVFENNLWVNGLPKSGKHVNSYSGDAGWVNPIQGGDVEGYRLSENSDYIGKGQHIQGLETDKFGIKRGIPPALGAIEPEGKRSNTEVQTVSSVDDMKKQPVPEFQVGLNVALNPHFDKVTDGIPDDWKLFGDTSACSIFTPGHTLSTPAIYGQESLPTTGNCVKLRDEGSFKVSLSQHITGIPNGRYGFHVRVKRFGEAGEMTAEISDFGGEKLECHFPLAKNMDEWSDYSKKFFQLNISDIEVTNGDCTITFSVTGNTGDYALIDDVVLYRY
jgi:parallel beta-helix repeat protein